MDRLGPGGLERTVGEIECGTIAAGRVADQLEFIRNEAILSEAWRLIPGLGEYHAHSTANQRGRPCDSKGEARLYDVANGCYDLGGTRANRNEAIAISDATSCVPF